VAEFLGDGVIVNGDPSIRIVQVIFSIIATLQVSLDQSGLRGNSFKGGLTMKRKAFY